MTFNTTLGILTSSEESLHQHGPISPSDKQKFMKQYAVLVWITRISVLLVPLFLILTIYFKFGVSNKKLSERMTNIFLILFLLFAIISVILFYVILYLLIKMGFIHS